MRNNSLTHFTQTKHADKTQNLPMSNFEREKPSENITVLFIRTATSNPHTKSFAIDLGGILSSWSLSHIDQTKKFTINLKSNVTRNLASVAPHTDA